MKTQSRKLSRQKGPDIRNLVEFIEEKLISLYTDIDKFDQKNNNSAGVRIRIQLQEIVYQIGDVRKEILIRKKKREEKKRREGKKKK